MDKFKDKSKLRSFIEGMPKIELHLHIEGSLEPELVFELVKRNGIKLYKKNPDGTFQKDRDGNKIEYKDAEELKATYKFSNLQEFLDLYYQGMSVLKTDDDFYELTKAYLTKLKSQNVTHTEIFFDPQQHIQNGVAFETVVNGINHALKEGEADMGISSKLIMSFLRHLPEKASAEEKAKIKEQAKAQGDVLDAFDLLTLADRYIKDGTIQGIGLDSSEAPFPPTLFQKVYSEAKKRYPNLKLMAHAGEEGSWEYVRDALDLLKVDRIDHGNHCLDNPKLVERLRTEKKGLTVCPLSNLRLNHTLDFEANTKLTDMKLHQLKKMMDPLKLKVTVNSDDPAYFRTDNGEGGYMNENFIAVADALNLERKDIIQLAKNAIETSFLSPEQKEQKTRELENYIAKVEAADKYVNTIGGRQF